MRITDAPFRRYVLYARVAQSPPAGARVLMRITDANVTWFALARPAQDQPNDGSILYRAVIHSASAQSALTWTLGWQVDGVGAFVGADEAVPQEETAAVVESEPDAAPGEDEPGAEETAP